MSTSPLSSQGSNPAVLVVDDEAAIREAVRDILELVDIETLLAANGQEAIALFREYHQNIGAVLLDLRMPIMSGRDTYQVIRSLDRGVSIIVSSGYDEVVATLDITGDQAVSFLRKPYAMDALLTRVQSALTL